MATVPSRLREQAEKVKLTMDMLKDIRSTASEVVAHHNANGFSAINDSPPPAWYQPDAEGNIDGVDFSKDDYLAAITLLQQLERFFTNLSVSTGDYQTTVGKVASA